jgi:protein ImuA
VVGEPDRAIALTASRRLQLAAETGGTTGLVLRRGAEDGALSPSAVFSRWRAGSLPMLAASSGSAEGARWRLELLRCRGGIGDADGDKVWIVDWCDATRNLSLVSGSRHRPAAAGAAERLAG